MRKIIPVFLLVGVAALGLLIGIHQQPKGKYHRSYFSQAEFFDQAYAKSPAAPYAPEEVRAILVNHHLLASDLIAQAFGVAVVRKPSVVVLFSPNHFGAGRGQIISSEWDWLTPYGALPGAKKLATELTNLGLIRIDEMPFEREHGVSGVVPFISESLPRASVLPIIIKSTASREEIDALVDKLKSLLPPDALIVASVDMSHYMTEEVSAKKDAGTIAALEHFDFDAIWRAEIDSPASVYATMRLMQAAGTTFQLLARDSSALRIGSTNPDDNTSYITGFWHP